MRLNQNILVYGFIFIAFLSCKRDNSQPVTGSEVFNSKEDYLKANQYLVKQDDEKIRGYVERRGWNMQQTESGLWYMIYENGNGLIAEKNLEIELDFTVTLIDGTPCYSSQDEGPKSFIIGKGGVESGLEEGVLLLKEGDKAKFIIPPHLAHGLLGDEKKIPPRAIIIYDIEVREVKNPNI